MLWALQNTTNTKMSVIYETESKIISAKITGTADGFPEVEKDLENNNEIVERA